MRSLPCLIGQANLAHSVGDASSGKRVDGFHIITGWQNDIIRRQVPIIFFGVWSCVIAWKLASEGWDTTLAFGNFIAALLTLVYTQAEYNRRESYADAY